MLPSTSVQIAKRFALVLPLTCTFCSAETVQVPPWGQVKLTGLSSATNPGPMATALQQSQLWVVLVNLRLKINPAGAICGALFTAGPASAVLGFSADIVVKMPAAITTIRRHTANFKHLFMLLSSC